MKINQSGVQENQPWEGIYGLRGSDEVRIDENRVYTADQTNQWLSYLGMKTFLPGETFGEWLKRTEDAKSEGEENGGN